MKKLFLLPLLLIITIGWSQTERSPKIILITLDGVRWQELFTGADPGLISLEEYVHNPENLKKEFWRETATARREALFPFMWTKVVDMGQLYGNRTLGNKVNLTNDMWFSYPGYNEILTGKADDTRISSNDKIPNPNTTVLEAYNKQQESGGKVAAFGSWDVFPYIINEERSGIPVNAGFESATGALSDREVFLNELQEQIPSPWDNVRLDAFTHHYALEYLKKQHPELLYIAYGETDDFAHNEDYQAYLKAAHNTDAMIRELWEYTQQDPFYKDQTVFLITTDHGRGTQPVSSWSGHGRDIAGCDQVWLAVFGPGIEPKGEMRTNMQLYSTQIAPTIAYFLGMEWEGEMIRVIR